MGVVADRGKGKYEIIYGGLESPFGGVDASKSNGAFIKPNYLQFCNDFCSNEGYLTAQLLQPAITFNSQKNDVSNPFLVGSYITAITDPITTSGTIIRQVLSYIIYTDNNNLYIEEYNGQLGNSTKRSGMLSIALAYPNTVQTLVSYTVNGIVYVTGLGLGAIYAYTPIGNGNSTLTLLTNYLGAACLGELNGRLVALAVQQVVAGPPQVWSYYPYQIAWSAAQGDYSQWNPLVGGLVTGAGFNNLPDVTDELVGFITTGPTGYAIRRQGITELTPLNSGTLPFDFNHLWASDFGIGSIYPNTVAQYGSMGAFLSDTGLYTLGYDGVNQIQGDYWDTIVNQVLLATGSTGASSTYEGIRGSLAPITVSNNTFIAYLLAIAPAGGSPDFVNICDVVNKTWTTVDSPTVSGGYFRSQAVYRGAIDSSATAAGTAIATFAYLKTAGTSSTPATYVFCNFVDSFTFAESFGAGQITFPIEEVSMFKDVTINAIGFYIDSDGCTFTPSINGVAFTPVTPNGPGLYMSYPATVGFCAKYPQLTLNTAFLGVCYAKVYKISLFASIDMTQVP